LIQCLRQARLQDVPLADHGLACPLLRDFPSVVVRPIPTPIFTNVLITAQPRQGSFKLTILPLPERNCWAIGMASCLLNFLVWFGSANIAARHSSIRHIGSKAKSPAWYSWISSFVTVVTCKRGNSDCVPRKSVFGIDLPQKPQQPTKKSRHCGDEQQSDGSRGVEASEGHVSHQRLTC
jgi:hypothetical protein